jgi:4-amino-4-deoxy-L-arabinose transferase-like glycosyltransferase
MTGPERRSLLAIGVLAMALHGMGVARSILPAQDGLKFIRVARAFQTQPFADVVRGADQHPLYPLLVAAAEPVVRLGFGRGPEAWRLAAQGVSTVAAVALILPLYSLARELFGRRIARLSALGFVLLPTTMTVGHDTLSDSLALLAFVLALRCGLRALRSNDWTAAAACGVTAGVGYLARPEVLIAPAAVVATGMLGALPAGAIALRRVGPRLAAVSVAFLAIVGGYAIVKGEVSEKLALRYAATVGSRRPTAGVARTSGQWLPPGLDDPRWDFSPKEEPATPERRSPAAVVRDLALQWVEGLGYIGAFFALWGFVRGDRVRAIVAESETEGEPDRDGVGRRLAAVYLILFTLVLARHEWKMGYLSGRHVLTLVIASLPWAAAGVFICARGAAVALKWPPTRARWAGVALTAAAVAAGAAIQSKPAHPTRWGHREAGRWLAANANPGEAVLDTRGWAAFVSGLPAYDYWHVRQAFTDANLSYIVVGEDELRAPSRRAETLRALLAFAGEPAAAFPERRGAREPGVHVYLYHRPASWEGLRP